MVRAVFIAGLMLCVAIAGPLAAQTPPAKVFDVPRLDGIVIDGSPQDWSERGFAVLAMAAVDGTVKAPADLDASFRLGWDARGLLMLVDVRDDVPYESREAGNLWQRDSVEMFLAPAVGGPDLVQVHIAPDMHPDTPDLRFKVHDHRKTAALKEVPVKFEAARAAQDGGWTLEALLPWDALGLAPAAGLHVAFQIYVNDADGPGGATRLVWFPQDQTHTDTRRMHTLRLALQPSKPVTATATARYERWCRLRVDVVATADRAGQTAALVDSGQVLTQGDLALEQGRAVAHLRAPLPPRGRRFGSVAVNLADQPITHLTLEDPD